MRFEWIERLEMKWVIWRKWARTTLWKSPYGQLKVNPIEVTWMNPMRMSLSKWMDSMRFEWIEVNRTIWDKMSEMIDLTWNNPMGISLSSIESVPIKVTWVNPMGISLWVENECPYQFDLNDISEKVPMFSWMNVPIKVTWNNPMRKSLWSSEGEPYRSDLMWVKINVPIKMTGMISMRKSLSKWSDLIE